MEKQIGENRSILKNTAYNLLKTFSQIIFPLITVPYVSRVLHAENLGKVNFGSSVVSYISLIASLGVTTYAIRECSKVRNDREQLEKTASQIFSINICSICMAYAVLAVLLVFWDSLENYRTLILIQSLSVIFSVAGADWLNSAMEDFRYIAVRTFCMQLFSLAAMIVLVRQPSDYMKYAVISVAAGSGANLVNIFYRRRFCRIHLTFQIEWKKHLKPVMLLFAMILAQQIFVNLDITIIGVTRSDYEVGLYSMAVKIYSMVNQVIASVAWVVMPKMSLFFLRKDYQEINRLLKYVTNIIAGLGIPCVTGLLMIAPEIIETVAGTEYVPAAVSLRILSVALAFSLIGGLLGNIILLPSGREGICLISNIFSAVVNLVLNLILIPHYGINAAAFTTMIAQMIGMVFFMFFIEKEIRIDYLAEVCRGPVIGGILIAAICIIVKYLVGGAYLTTVLCVGISTVVYSAVMLRTRNALAMEVKEKLLSRLRKR